MPTTSVRRGGSEEYALADRLLCPSDFVVQTFRDEGFPPAKLARHDYGFDETVFYPDTRPRARIATADGCLRRRQRARKGLHFALEAWRRSPLSTDGRFLVVGELPSELRREDPDRSLGRRRWRSSVTGRMSPTFIGKATSSSCRRSRKDRRSLASRHSAVAAFRSSRTSAPASACTGRTRSCTGRRRDALTEQLTMLREDRELLERLRAGASELGALASPGRRPVPGCSTSIARSSSSRVKTVCGWRFNLRHGPHVRQREGSVPSLRQCAAEIRPDRSLVGSASARRAFAIGPVVARFCPGRP